MGEDKPEQVSSDDAAFVGDDAAEGSGLSGAFELPEGILPDLEAEFGAVASPAGDDPNRGEDGDEVGSEFSEFAELDNPEMAADLIGETSQDELPGGWESSDDFDEDEEAAAGPQVDHPMEVRGGRRDAVQGSLPPRPLRRKHASGSVVGVVVGGLMAIPIVIVILLWGFRRDDFGIARVMPETLSFLIPQELRAPRASRGLRIPDPRGLPRLPEEGLVAADDPLAGARAAEDDRVVSEMPAGTGGALPLDEATDGRDEPAEDALLAAADLAMLEMATARAGVMLASVLGVPEDAPDSMRKAALVDWYKSLAAVGEEAVATEQVMAESGRSTTRLAQPLASMVQRIGENPAAYAEFGDLAQQWIKATKRDSQGIVVPGRIAEVRQVGMVWTSTLHTGVDGAESPLVTVLSSRPPAMEEGTEVVAVGVMVAGDAMWAASFVTRDADGSMPAGDVPVSAE